MLTSYFFPSNTLANIRSNVIVLHATVLFIGGFYLLYEIFKHDTDAIRSQLTLAYLTIGFGLFNFIAAKLRSQLLVSVGLLIWFFVLAYRSFVVIDPTYAAIGVNIAFLSLIILVTLYYHTIVGFSLLILITLMNTTRWFLVQNNHLDLAITVNTGIFETNFLTIFSVYSCAIAGYYQYQASSYIQKLKQEKRALSVVIGERRRSKTQLKQMLREIKEVTYKAIPSFEPKIGRFLASIEQNPNQPIDELATDTKRTMQQLDGLLREIDTNLSSFDVK